LRKWRLGETGWLPLSRFRSGCAVVVLSTRRWVTGNDPARPYPPPCNGGSLCSAGGARRPEGKMTQRCAVAGSDSRPEPRCKRGTRYVALRRTTHAHARRPCIRAYCARACEHARRAMLCVARGLCGLYGPCGPYWQAVQAGVSCTRVGARREQGGSKAARMQCCTRRDCVSIHTQPFLFAPPAQNCAFQSAQ
jgi:hypothetical protein